jgi:D-threo-aldose 1-dehydrogenase
MRMMVRRTGIREVSVQAANGRRYGSTGLEVTDIGLGTSSWGPLRPHEFEEHRDRRIGALGDAFFAGDIATNLLDTSNLYGQSQSELLIGKAIRAAGGVPDGLVVQTKVDQDPDSHKFDGAQVWRSLEQSLERLGVDSVQMLFLHDPEGIGFDAAVAPRGALEALIEMRDQGVAQHIGIAAGPVSLLTRFVETDALDAVLSHNRYTLVDRSADRLFDAAAQRGMGICNAAPFGGGALTEDPARRDRYAYVAIHPEVRAAIDAIAAVCADADVPLPAAALQFSVRDPRIHSTIVGASSLDRFHAALDYRAVVIPEDVWDEIERHVPPQGTWLDPVS